jgi:hypothetical protein
VARRITYWHVDDIEFTVPAIALPIIVGLVRNLIAKLRVVASGAANEH